MNGTRAISADTALRLGKYFGTSPEMWLDLQSDYELESPGKRRGHASKWRWLHDGR